MNNLKSLKKQFPNITYTHLGSEDLIVSDIGFGTYRVHNDSDIHFEALKKAIHSGINLIDTSANYMDGSAETLIGRVIEDCEQENLSRSNIVIVTKAGYIQGSNLEHSTQRKSQGIAFPEIVELSEELQHCIHPQFLEDQLERSLRRLNLTYVDVFLLHNPEYYLEWAQREGIDVQTAQHEYYTRIQNAFAYLEQQVENGRIRCYGISSNTFPSPETSYTHTSLKKVLECAQNITKDHHFTVIQCPMNLYEAEAATESPSVLEIAEKNGIGVLINRPLNAIRNNRLTRLVDYQIDHEISTLEIEDLIQELVEIEMEWESFEIASTELPENIQTLIHNCLSMGTHLQEYWASFQGIEHWKEVMDYFIIPRIEKAVEILGNECVLTQFQDEWLRNYIEYLNLITKNITLYYKAYGASQAESIKHHIKTAIPDVVAPHSLTHTAIRTLRNTPGVTSVLVGMRQDNYVDDILNEAHQTPTKTMTPTHWKALQTALKKDIYS